MTMSTTLQPVRLRLLTGWIAMGTVAMSFHWRAVLLVGVPLAVFALFPATARHPGPWLVAAAAWVPLGVVGWSRLEDHVYFGAYLVLAVGVALTREDPRASLREQVRLVTGALFAVAVIWKVTSMEFLRGDVFHTVMVYDGRFDTLTQSLGGISQSTIDANRSALQAMEQTTATLDSVPIAGGTQVALLLVVMIVWTLVVEAGIAVSFLAPDNHRLARFRHVTLIAFGLSTYPFVPVVGFAIMFTAVGLILSDNPRVQALYLAVTLGAFASLALRAAF